MRKGTILLATMSEVQTIDAVLQEIAEGCHNLERFQWTLEVLVVEDGTTESFPILCTNLGDRYGVSVQVERGPGAGLGAAILQGFDSALSDPDIEFVINLDADGQHDGRQIGDLLRAHLTSSADITIGSRWTRGGRCYGLSFGRKIVSRTSAKCLHLAGVPRHVKDPTTSFRVYGRKALETISRDLVGFNGFSFFGASIALAESSGLKVVETPIHFRPRLAGNSNLRFAQVRRAVQDLPLIASVSHMTKSRRINFLEAQHGNSGPDDYNATRELELLSNTPVSTRIIVDELNTFLGSRVLEIGAGLGQISSHLVNRNRTVVAVEPDNNLHSKLIERVGNLVEATLNCTLESALETQKISTLEKFDSILYVNVLEHIEDDIHELSVAKSFIETGGKIVIFVPAMPSLYGTMDAISGHYRRYRRHELCAVIERAGLSVERAYYFDPLGALPYWLSYRVLSRKSLGGGTVALYDRVIIPMSLLISRITKRRGLGKNLIAIATLKDSISAD
jgi:2-polyprenyl-3-methyl-5-hydroxy-6-metoxy-1,4-benzoquinol methylase